MKHLLLIPAALTLLSACKDETISGYADSTATWALIELNGMAFPATATITFPKKGQIEGDGPCNSYSATQTAPYPWFEAGPIVATERACADLGAEADFFTALGQVNIAEVSGGTLILSNKDGHELVFMTAPR